MKKLTAFATATALAATMATGAMAGENTKLIKPLESAKSTQAVPPVSLGLGGLGAGATTALIVGGVITTIVIIQATSGT
jgi:ABC-type proline/glycine betaine transport system substrate-binding protein